MKNLFSILFFWGFIFTASAESNVLVNFSEKNCAKEPQKIEALNKEAILSIKHNKETAKLYQLKGKETLKEITLSLLKHANTTAKVKKSITQDHHQYYIFSYPSDGLTVKGYISLPSDHKAPIPLIILLRGGFNLFSLPHPGGLSVQKGYAVIMPTYRGGVSEGKDEFGGNDINDVKHLVDFLPTLEQKLNIQFHPTKKYMIGVSRGGMELFLTLGRYPEIQKQFKKVVSISGLLDISQAVDDRSDFKDTLEYHFGLDNNNSKVWLAKRNAINYVPKLSKDLSIMIAQGTKDPRVCLKEGYGMLQALNLGGHHKVTYIEVEGGDHVLRNTPDFTFVLMDWLESES